MSKEEYIDRVVIIAKHKYDLDEDIIRAFEEELEFCWENNFGPIRTVEILAEKIF